MTRSVIAFSLFGSFLLSACDDKTKKIDTGTVHEDTAAGDTDPDADTGGPEPSDTGTTDTDCAGEATDGDSDGDGVPDAIEEASDSLSSASADTDGDGVCDGDEDTDEDGLSNSEELSAGTDPNDIDSDDDGIADGAEVVHDLDPLNPADGAQDPDADGLSNAEEIGINGSGSDPLLWDSDSDGFPDGYEVSNASDPTDRDSEPTFDEILTCTDMTSARGTHFFVDANSDGRADEIVESYYGADYERNQSAYECTCTMSLGEAYARIADLVVFTPTDVHQNSPWEDAGTQQPIIGAVQVPFRSGPKSDGAFLLDNVSQSKMADLNEDTRLHWLAEPTDSVSSSGVVNLEGDYTVWVSVKNPEGSVIEDDDSTYESGCERLSGNDGSSGYEGYLRLSLIPTSNFTGNGVIETTNSTNTQTRFMLATGLGGRLHMLAVGGSANFAKAPLTAVTVADWNGASRVQLRDRAGVIATLTEDNNTAALPEPLWLHQLEVVVEGDGALPTLAAAHTEVLRSPPQPPGQRFSLSLQQLNTFLVSMNSLLTTAVSLPEGADQTMSALQVRIETPSGPSGPTWLRVDARGSGALFRLPLAPVAGGGWSFETSTDTFFARGSVSVNSAGNLSIRLEEGSVGSLPLQEATLSVESD